MTGTLPTICFVNPPHPYLKQPRAQLPLGMLYVAASAMKNGYTVSYHDLSEEKEWKQASVPEADVYGITATVLDISTVNEVAGWLKARDKYAKVVVGGPASLSQEYIDKKVVDSVVEREGEVVFLQLLNDYPRLRNRYRGRRIQDLDALPFPARDLVQGQLGGDVFASGKRHYDGGSTVISTSRGCPFDCTFCASPGIWGRKIVYRSPSSVASEVHDVIGRYGVRQFRFSDDNLTCSRDNLTAMCRYFRSMDIAWRASIRVRPNDVEMFRMMRSGGCTEVCFGVESGDQDVLHALKKKTTVAENRTAIKNAKRAGLDVRILFMIGTPGETKATVGRNIEFLESVQDDYDTIAITNFTPLPGTEVAKEPEKCGCVILDRNVDNYNLCLWGPEGRNRWLNLVRPVGVSLEQLTANKELMVEYVLATGKSNSG